MNLENLIFYFTIFVEKIESKKQQGVGCNYFYDFAKNAFFSMFENTESFSHKWRKFKPQEKVTCTITSDSNTCDTLHL